MLVELAARHAEAPPPVGLELIFTVAEEDGLRGAKELDVSALRSPYGFALDHATPIGEVIVAAPTYKRLRAAFTGQEAHSGINPEDGHNAIAAAAAAIAGMKLGRLDEETTANVGVIEGGTASNVVAGHCNAAGGGAQHRRRASRRGGRGDGRCLHLGRRRARLRRRRPGERDVPRLPPRSVGRAGPARLGGAPRAGPRALAGGDRRGQRRQRPDRLGIRVRAARQRHRGEPHPRGAGERRRDRRDARDLRGDRRGGLRGRRWPDERGRAS